VNNDFGKGGRDTFTKEMAARNIKVVADISTESGQADFSADVVKIAAANADAIFVYLNEEESARFLSGFMNAFAAWVDRSAAPAAPAFDAFLEARERISNAYIEGKAEALHPILATRDPASFFGPDGGCANGADGVKSAYDRGAQAFAPGSTGHFEILQREAGGMLAYWTGYQHAEVRMKDKPDAIAMKLRTTEIFRLEDGAWKLVHRHADPAKDKREE